MLSSPSSSRLASLTLLYSIILSTLAAPLQIESGPGRLLIDTFDDAKINALGRYRGESNIAQLDDEEQRLSIATDIIDEYFDISLGEGCTDLVSYSQHFLHIIYSGSSKFSVSLQQHNAACSGSSEPYPETWDSVEAARYTSASRTDIWVPISHFNINLARTTAISLESFYTTLPTHFYKIELVPHSEVPANIDPPQSVPTGDLVFRCKVPSTFAFGIGEGSPELAQKVLQVLKEEDVKVTFFAVGSGLANKSTNLTNVYKEALSLGHQVGLHSWSHPKMEALPSDEDIDQQFRWNIDAMRENLGINSTYFRPPYGTIGARTRGSLCRHIPDSPTIVMWDIDVEDWIWADSIIPERQLEMFKLGVNRGGSLVMLHYFSASTIEYLREMIRYVKIGGAEGGRRIVTVEECMGGNGSA